MQLTDPIAGERSRVYLFVASLPFSRYAFVEPVDLRITSPMLKVYRIMSGSPATYCLIRMA